MRTCIVGRCQGVVARRRRVQASQSPVAQALEDRQGLEGGGVVGFVATTGQPMLRPTQLQDRARRTRPLPRTSTRLRGSANNGSEGSSEVDAGAFTGGDADTAVLMSCRACRNCRSGEADGIGVIVANPFLAVSGRRGEGASYAGVVAAGDLARIGGDLGFGGVADQGRRPLDARRHEIVPELECRAGVDIGMTRKMGRAVSINTVDEDRNEK